DSLESRQDSMTEHDPLPPSPIVTMDTSSDNMLLSRTQIHEPIDDLSQRREALATSSSRSPDKARVLDHRIWITWETQRRNRTLSAALGATLSEFDINARPVVRYCKLLWRTLGLLRQSKPDLIIAQNPSLVLALFTCWYGRLCRKPVVVDAHNA